MVTQQRPQRADMTSELRALAEAAEATWGNPEPADDPTLDTHVGEVVHRPNEQWGAPIGVSERTGNWVTVYSTLDGEPRVINRNNYAATMQKVNNDPAYPQELGKRAFSDRPTKEYRLGTHKCQLHPEHPAGNYPLYQAWGLPVCWSAHFPSEFEVTRHMQMDHKSAWAAIRDDQDKRREQDARDTQNAILRQLVERTTAAPVAMPMPVPTMIPEPPEPVKVRVDRTTTRACEFCGEEFTGAAPIAVSNLLNRHKKAAHPAAT